MGLWFQNHIKTLKKWMAEVDVFLKEEWPALGDSEILKKQLKQCRVRFFFIWHFFIWRLWYGNYYLMISMVLNQGQFCPSSGHSAMSGDIFTCLNLRWGRCCCRLVDWGQGHILIFYNAENSTMQQRITPSKRIVVPRLRNWAK